MRPLASAVPLDQLFSLLLVQPAMRCAWTNRPFRLIMWDGIGRCRVRPLERARWVRKGATKVDQSVAGQGRCEPALRRPRTTRRPRAGRPAAVRPWQVFVLLNADVGALARVSARARRMDVGDGVVAQEAERLVGGALPRPARPDACAHVYDEDRRSPLGARRSRPTSPGAIGSTRSSPARRSGPGPSSTSPRWCTCAVIRGDYEQALRTHVLPTFADWQVPRSSRSTSGDSSLTARRPASDRAGLPHRRGGRAARTGHRGTLRRARAARDRHRHTALGPVRAARRPAQPDQAQRRGR